MATMTTTCDHTAGFRDLHAVEPRPGHRPEVLKGTCIGCGELRYFDLAGGVYRTPRDAYQGENAERVRS